MTFNQAEAASKPIQHNEIEEVSAQRKCEDHFVATLTEIGQIKPDQIKRRLRVDDTFKQSKRELGIVLILNEKIYVFLVRNWTGNYRPGPDGKFWLKRTEYEESITVEQIKSPLVELQVITKCFIVGKLSFSWHEYRTYLSVSLRKIRLGASNFDAQSLDKEWRFSD